MKKIVLIFSIALISITSVWGQNFIDKINIYIIPFSTDYVSESGIDPDFVRVRHTYQISFTQMDHIREFVSKFNSISKELIETVAKEKVNSCRIVIDFVQSSRIMESIVIHRDYSLSFDEPYSKYKIYKYDKEFLCYLEEQFPSIIKLNHKDINCSN